MTTEGRARPVIVVADDDADNLKIVQLKLEANGFRVVTTRNGQEALAAVRQSKPALVILDVMMPRLNGFQVARMIKFDKQLKVTPVIFLTVRTEPADRETGTQVGADEYLTRPYDPDKLVERVRHHIERQLKQRAEPPPG